MRGAVLLVASTGVIHRDNLQSEFPRAPVDLPTLIWSARSTSLKSREDTSEPGLSLSTWLGNIRSRGLKEMTLEPSFHKIENMDSVSPDYNYTTTGSILEEDDDLCDLDPNPTEVMTRTYIHAIICAFGLIGNILVIVTYIFYKRTKAMTDVYLFNVAVADLIFVVALPFIIYNEQHSWLMGLVVCKMLRAAYSINLYSCMLLLACISADRYFAIVQARRTFGARSRTLFYSRLICGAVWLLAVTLTLPTLIYTELFEEPNLWDGTITKMCELSFSTHEKAKLLKVLVPSLQMAIGFLLPLLVMLFCYSSIVCTLVRAQSTQRHKAVRVVLAVVLVFIVCHLPYNVVLLDHTLSLFKERGCSIEQLKLLVLSISRSIAYLHCCLNPILYAFIGVKFRNHFRQIMLDLWCFSKKYIYSSRLSRGTTDVCISVIKASDGSNNMSSFSA